MTNPTPENGEGTAHSCDKHDGVQIQFKGGQCPLCAAVLAGEAVSIAAVKTGMVLVEMSVGQIPFRFVPAPGFEAIVTAYVGRINAALKELTARLTGQEPGMVKPAPRGLVVPR